MITLVVFTMSTLNDGISCTTNVRSKRSLCLCPDTARITIPLSVVLVLVFSSPNVTYLRQAGVAFAFARRSGHLKVSCWRGLKEFAGSVEVTQKIENLMPLVIGLCFHSSAIKDVDHDVAGFVDQV